jgi:hypothetical protein
MGSSMVDISSKNVRMNRDILEKHFREFLIKISTCDSLLSPIQQRIFTVLNLESTFSILVDVNRNGPPEDVRNVEIKVIS